VVMSKTKSMWVWTCPRCCVDWVEAELGVSRCCPVCGMHTRDMFVEEHDEPQAKCPRCSRYYDKVSLDRSDGYCSVCFSHVRAGTFKVLLANLRADLAEFADALDEGQWSGALEEGVQRRLERFEQDAAW